MSLSADGAAKKYSVLFVAMLAAYFYRWQGGCIGPPLWFKLKLQIFDVMVFNRIYGFKMTKCLYHKITDIMTP